MSLFRLLLYGIIAYIIFRIFRILTRATSSRSHEPDFRAKPPAKGAGIDLSSIEDAHFEDITPKKEDKGTPPSGNARTP